MAVFSGGSLLVGTAGRTDLSGGGAGGEPGAAPVRFDSADRRSPRHGGAPPDPRPGLLLLCLGRRRRDVVHRGGTRLESVAGDRRRRGLRPLPALRAPAVPGLLPGHRPHQPRRRRPHTGGCGPPSGRGHGGGSRREGSRRGRCPTRPRRGHRSHSRIMGHRDGRQLRHLGGVAGAVRRPAGAGHRRHGSGRPGENGACPGRLHRRRRCALRDGRMDGGGPSGHHARDGRSLHSSPASSPATTRWSTCAPPRNGRRGTSTVPSTAICPIWRRSCRQGWIANVRSTSPARAARRAATAAALFADSGYRPVVVTGGGIAEIVQAKRTAAPPAR